MVDQTAPFQQLDFLYTPAVTWPDLVYFTDVLGGRVVFAIEAMGTRVAAVQVTPGSRWSSWPITSRVNARFCVPVDDLGAAWPGLRPEAGSGSAPWRSLTAMLLFRTPGGHRIALYQLTRPEVAAHFNGRRDFCSQLSRLRSYP